MTLETWFPDLSLGWPADLDLAGLEDSSAQHPSDEFYFGDFGWMTPQQAVARNGVDLLMVCDRPS